MRARQWKGIYSQQVFFYSHTSLDHECERNLICVSLKSFQCKKRHESLNRDTIFFFANVHLYISDFFCLYTSMHILERYFCIPKGYGFQNRVLYCVKNPVLPLWEELEIMLHCYGDWKHNSSTYWHSEMLRSSVLSSSIINNFRLQHL